MQKNSIQTNRCQSAEYWKKSLAVMEGKRDSRFLRWRNTGVIDEETGVAIGAVMARHYSVRVRLIAWTKIMSDLSMRQTGLL